MISDLPTTDSQTSAFARDVLAGLIRTLKVTSPILVHARRAGCGYQLFAFAAGSQN